jgi:AcrR family transcriptional regulator
MTEPSERHVARREEIIDTAIRVFHAKGYESGSIEDVARSLDLRKGAIYHYFPSKAHLLYSIFDRTITTALISLQEYDRIADPLDRLAALIRHQATLVAGDAGLFTVFFDQRPRLEEAFEREIRSKERRYLRSFETAVEAAVSAGALVAVDPRYAAQAILGMANWTYKWFQEGRDSPERVADVMIRLILPRPIDFDRPVGLNREGSAN